MGRELVVATTAVDPDFFEVFQAAVLAGRGFAPHDTGAGANTVVVNHLFVDRMLGGRNAVGRAYVTKWKMRKPSRSRDRGLKSSAWCAIWCQTHRLP